MLRKKKVNYLEEEDDEEDFDYKNEPPEGCYWSVKKSSIYIPTIEPSEDDNRYNDDRVYDDDEGYDSW